MIKSFLQTAIILSFFINSPLMFGKVFGQDFETTPLYECFNLKTKMQGTQFASDNVNIFYPNLNGQIESLNLKDGKLNWKIDLGGEIFSNISLDGEILYLFTKSEKNSEKNNEIQDNKTQLNSNIITLRAISVLTGIPIWQNNIEILENDSIPFLKIINNNIYILTTFGEVFIIDKISSKVKEKVSLNIKLTSKPVNSEDNIYLTTENRDLYIFKIESRELIKITTLNEVIKVISISMNNQDLFMGDILGMVYKYNLDTKKNDWKIRTGAEIKDIVENKEEDVVIISSNDNFIYSISRSTGNISWKKRLAGRSKISLIKNEKRNLVFSTTLNEDTFTILDLKNGSIINQIFLDEDKYFVGSPTIFSNYLLLPTSTGFSAYSLKPC